MNTKTIYDIDPVDVIQTITGSRKSAQLEVRNGHDNIYSPEDFISDQKQFYAENPDLDKPDFDKMLDDAQSGDLRFEGAHNGFVDGIPFVWLHG